MAVRLNHTIVSARDHSASARFLTEILGLSAPVHLGPFAIVQVGDTSLDFMESGGKINTQHYAFLVTELEFDEIFARIRQRDLTYWADPSQKQSGQINEWDGGRGVYWEDPNGLSRIRCSKHPKNERASARRGASPRSPGSRWSGSRRPSCSGDRDARYRNASRRG